MRNWLLRQRWLWTRRVVPTPRHLYLVIWEHYFLGNTRTFIDRDHEVPFREWIEEYIKIL